jgi:hypothetical protein
MSRSVERTHEVDGIVPRRPLLHLLAGVNLRSLARTMWRHGGCSPRSYPQLAILFVSALLRWPGCVAEALRVARRVRHVPFDPPPVFIVGHWRSGTTLLHNLMSRDSDFCYPTIVDALRPYDFYPNPLDFITREVVLRFLPSVRPMDDVRLDPELPQEDELALATMGAPSFFNCFYFPKHMTNVFAEEVLFENGSEDTVRLWRHALTYYLAKLAALNPGRRLLLKSPAHSARIPELLALFPGAKFIHIHRDPTEVFQSTRKLYQRMLPLLALQDYRPADIDRHILWSYPEVMNRLLAALATLPAERTIVIRYGDLVADPTKVVDRIYCDLNLGDFRRVKSLVEGYANEYPHTISPAPALDSQMAARLAREWGPVYARLGYPPPAS